MNEWNRKFLLISLSTFTFVSLSGCGSGKVNEVNRIGQSEPSPSPTPSPSAPVKPTDPTRFGLTYDGKCTNASIKFYGESHRYVVRLNEKGNCPENQNEVSDPACFKDYSFAVEREYFLGVDCQGTRTAVISEFFTLPVEQGDFGEGVAIDTVSGPAVIRVWSDALFKVYQDQNFCGVVWDLNQNIEVTGKKCGVNAPFLDEKTPLYSIWKVDGATIQFGASVFEESERPKTLDDSLVFKLRDSGSLGRPSSPVDAILGGFLP
jgi:hypothetical protein